MQHRDADSREAFNWKTRSDGVVLSIISQIISQAWCARIKIAEAIFAVGRYKAGFPRTIRHVVIQVFNPCPTITRLARSPLIDLVP